MGIQNLKDSVPQTISNLAPVVVLGAGGVWILAKVGSQVYQYVQTQRMLKKWKETPKDVVILHQLSRGKTAPNLSPFALKLETYLRMANIPYQNDFEYPMGPKQKTPWITLNGEHVGDSELIIDLLSKKFNKRIGNYTDQQRAVGELARVATDEYLYWGMTSWRYVHGDLESLKDLFDMPPLVLTAFGRAIRKRVTVASTYQGIGRHSKEDIETLMKRTLRALSLVLDSRKFFLGDEPSEIDCTVFGMIAQYLWCMPGASYEAYISDDLPNLVDYAIRMKEHFWPDWDKSLAGAQVQLPTTS